MITPARHKSCSHFIRNALDIIITDKLKKFIVLEKKPLLKIYICTYVYLIETVA